MDDLLKIILFVIVFWFILIAVICYSTYKKYKKAKNSWKVIYNAKMNISENLRYNSVNMFKNKFFAIMIIIGISANIFGLILGIIQIKISSISFNMALLLYWIAMVVIIKKPNILTKFGLKLPILKNISIYDKGIIDERDKWAMTWKQFKGYKKKDNEYIYLITKKKAI